MFDMYNDFRTVVRFMNGGDIMKYIIKEFFKRRSIILAISIIGFMISFSFFTADVHSSPDIKKIYKSIEVEYGDTLWSIALEYYNKEITSIEDYIDEIKDINSLTSSKINSGNYLIVMEYR